MFTLGASQQKLSILRPKKHIYCLSNLIKYLQGLLFIVSFHRLYPLVLLLFPTYIVLSDFITCHLHGCNVHNASPHMYW